MTPAGWAYVKDLWSVAIEKSPADREAFLDAACPDAVLREEVGKLLRSGDSPTLESPIPRLFGPRGFPAAIGRYRIIRLIGEGGMGSVYEAEQDQPRRVVAIKAIRPGLATPALLRRFEHEAQALGLLHHPGIAQVYEANTADWGFGRQPYFAMEFVQGKTLLGYIQDRTLPLRARLEMVGKICDAVHYAHQKGVIHRDLKPGNILIDETGQPKIVDFGVARVTDVDATASRNTDSGQILGTLSYMSPEQVMADPAGVDTRTDVYALGVILYELLAGRLPYQIGDQLTSAVQTICEADPARLSTIDRNYRGDIETIVAKALEKDKTRRYSSAAELAADIQRYLDDEPILAHRPSNTYQLGKFARRHRPLVVSAVVAFVMLCAGVIASSWEATRARKAEQDALSQRDAATAARSAAQEERDRAIHAERNAESERARAIVEAGHALTEKQHADIESASAAAINDFLLNDLLGQASSIGQLKSGFKADPDLKVRTALDRAASRIAGRFDRQPQVELAIRRSIAYSYVALGLHAEAGIQLQRVLDLQQRIGIPMRDRLTTSHLLANAYRQSAKYAESEALFKQTIDAWRRLHDEMDPESLSTQHELAMLYAQQGQFARAELIAARVLEERRRLLGPEHGNTLASMGDLAIIYVGMGKNDDAERLFRQIIEPCKRVLGGDHLSTLTAISNLGELYHREKKFSLAEPLLTEALEGKRRALGEEHSSTLTTMNSLANLYRQTGRSAESETMLVKVLQINRRIVGPDHVDTLRASISLVNNYSDQGRYDEAEPLIAETLEISRRKFGESSRITSQSRYALAGININQGKLGQAQQWLLPAVEAMRRLYGDEHSDTLSCSYRLGALYRLQGKYPDAEMVLTKTLDAMQRVLGADHPDTIAAQVQLGAVYQEEKKIPEADTHLTSSLARARRILGKAHSTARLAMASLGKLRLLQERYSDAETLFRDSFDRSFKENPYTWLPFERESLLGLAVLEQSRFAEAEPMLMEGYRGLQRHRTVVPPTVSAREAGERIVRLYEHWPKPEQAAQWRKDLEAAESQPVSTVR